MKTFFVSKQQWYTEQYMNELEMWANAQRDGRPAKHRWRLCSMPQSLAEAQYQSAV